MGRLLGLLLLLANDDLDILLAMDPTQALALQALDRAERTEAARTRQPLSEQYLRDIEAVMARPDNQDGADKSHVWLAYEFCRQHFAGARPA